MRTLKFDYVCQIASAKIRELNFHSVLMPQWALKLPTWVQIPAPPWKKFSNFSYSTTSFIRGPGPGIELSSYGSHPVSKLQEADVDVLLEPVGDVRVGPTTPILQGLGQVPVVQGDCWLDFVFDKLVDDGIVVVDASLIHFPGP